MTNNLEATSRLGTRLTDLREKVQVTYWSELHYISEPLFQLLPFGRALGPTEFYHFIDFEYERVTRLTEQTREYWAEHPTYTYNQELVSALTISIDDTFFWHYYTPARTREITEALLQGNRIRFLSSFHVSETEIKVEFQEIRLLTTEQGTQLVGTLGNEYTYRPIRRDWTVTSLNTDVALVNPSRFFYPITIPNTHGRETQYTEELSHILSLPYNFGIDRHYWSSVDSTEVDETLPPSSISRVQTPELPRLDDWCGCRTDLCYCDKYRPGTPPTPPYIELWNPRLCAAPIPGLHYLRQG